MKVHVVADGERVTLKDWRLDSLDDLWGAVEKNLRPMVIRAAEEAIRFSLTSPRPDAGPESDAAFPFLDGRKDAGPSLLELSFFLSDDYDRPVQVQFDLHDLVADYLRDFREVDDDEAYRSRLLVLAASLKALSEEIEAGL